jgi:hypothetical protein
MYDTYIIQYMFMCVYVQDKYWDIHTDQFQVFTLTASVHACFRQ